jgi:hypothetical protein
MVFVCRAKVELREAVWRRAARLAAGVSLAAGPGLIGKHKSSKHRPGRWVKTGVFNFYVAPRRALLSTVHAMHNQSSKECNAA